MTDVQTTLAQQIQDHDIVLYMKGTPEFPQCGFSFHVVQILQQHQVNFFAINVLENQEIREGIKVFSDWPTIPQLYVRGTFVGGCDIVQSLAQSGELATLLAAPSTQD